jgi:hypothetical protein
MNKIVLLILMMLIAGCSGKNVSTRNIQPEILPTNTELVEVDIFSVDGIKHFSSMVDANLSKDDFNSVVINPIESRLPEKKSKKISAKDKSTLLQAFEDAKSEVFEGYPLSDQVGSDTLVINTYLTDEIPSNPLVNYAFWIIVPALDVGAAAIETEVDLGDRRVAVAVGARNGTIGVSGYTKWGVIGQGFKIWLTGMRQWLDCLETSNCVLPKAPDDQQSN